MCLFSVFAKNRPVLAYASLSKFQIQEIHDACSLLRFLEGQKVFKRRLIDLKCLAPILMVCYMSCLMPISCEHFPGRVDISSHTMRALLQITTTTQYFLKVFQIVNMLSLFSRCLTSLKANRVCAMVLQRVVDEATCRSGAWSEHRRQEHSATVNF